jgi:hypothetical protein
MQITNDQIEDMVQSLHKFNADQVTYRFDIEKEGERFTFEISLKRKEEDFDE